MNYRITFIVYLLSSVLADMQTDYKAIQLMGEAYGVDTSSITPQSASKLVAIMKMAGPPVSVPMVQAPSQQGTNSPSSLPPISQPSQNSPNQPQNSQQNVPQQISNQPQNYPQSGNDNSFPPGPQPQSTYVLTPQNQRSVSQPGEQYNQLQSNGPSQSGNNDGSKVPSISGNEIQNGPSQSGGEPSGNDGSGNGPSQSGSGPLGNDGSGNGPSQSGSGPLGNEEIGSGPSQSGSGPVQDGSDNAMGNSTSSPSPSPSGTAAESTPQNPSATPSSGASTSEPAVDPFKSIGKSDNTHIGSTNLQGLSGSANLVTVSSMIFIPLIFLIF